MIERNARKQLGHGLVSSNQFISGCIHMFNTQISLTTNMALEVYITCTIREKANLRLQFFPFFFIQLHFHIPWSSRTMMKTTGRNTGQDLSQFKTIFCPAQIFFMWDLFLNKGSFESTQVHRLTYITICTVCRSTFKNPTSAKKKISCCDWQKHQKNQDTSAYFDTYYN